MAGMRQLTKMLNEHQRAGIDAELLELYTPPVLYI